MDLHRDKGLERAKAAAIDVANVKPDAPKAMHLLSCLARITMDALKCCESGQKFESSSLAHLLGLKSRELKSSLCKFAFAFAVLMSEMEGTRIGRSKEDENQPIEVKAEQLPEWEEARDDFVWKEVKKEEAEEEVDQSMGRVEETQHSCGDFLKMEDCVEDQVEIGDGAELENAFVLDDAIMKDYQSGPSTFASARRSLAERSAFDDSFANVDVTDEGPAARKRWACVDSGIMCASEMEFTSHSHPYKYHEFYYACWKCGYRTMLKSAMDRHERMICLMRMRPEGTTLEVRKAWLDAAKLLVRARDQKKELTTMKKRRMLPIPPVQTASTTRNRQTETTSTSSSKPTPALPPAFSFFTVTHKEMRKVSREMENRKADEPGVTRLKCAVCAVELRYEDVDGHFESKHRGYWFSRSTKCTVPACDYRSMIVEERREHTSSHQTLDVAHLYEKLSMGCPFCKGNSLWFSDFSAHMLKCHQLLMLSKEPFLVCESCEFATDRIYKLVDHWQKSDGLCEVRVATDREAVRRMREEAEIQSREWMKAGVPSYIFTK